MRTLCYPIKKYKLFMYFIEIIAVYSKNYTKPTGLNNFYEHPRRWKAHTYLLTYLLHGAESFLRS